MIVQIDVKPETANLIAEAKDKGVSVDAVLRQALESEISSEELMSIDKWDTALRELIDSPAFAKAPPLSDDAFKRENIYTREDDMR